MRDDQNERDPLALLMRTGDPIRLAGYVPRYYTDDVRGLEEYGGPGRWRSTSRPSIGTRPCSTVCAAG